MNKLLLSSIIAFSVFMLAFSNNLFSAPPPGLLVIKFNDVPYDGKRLYIGPVTKTHSSSGDKIAYSLSNTGRKDLRIGGEYSDWVINLDPSMQSLGKGEALKNIVLQILGEKKFLKAGAVLTNQTINISSIETSPSATVSKLPNSDAKTSTTPDKKDKPETKKPTRPEPEEIDMGNGTIVLEVPEKEDGKRGKFLDPNNCPDLMIKNIEVIKVNKFMIAIEYTVKNQGNGTAMLHGPKNNTIEDNMFLKGYLSATPKFTRSAIEIGEAAVKKEVGQKDGSLDRSKEFKGKMYFNVRGRTSLTPYLIVTLDPYQTVRECNERNNRSYIKIE